MSENGKPWRRDDTADDPYWNAPWRHLKVPPTLPEPPLAQWIGRQRGQGTGGKFFNRGLVSSVPPEEIATGPRSGFLDNLFATFASTEATELMVSENRMINDAVAERRAKIEEITGQSYDEALAPFMPEPNSELGLALAERDAAPIGQGRTETLAEAEAIERLRESLPPEKAGRILSNAQIPDRAREIALERVIEAEEVAARGQGFGSIAGQFLGSMGAQLTDPLVAGSMALGPASGARLAVAAAINGVLGGAVTAAQQPKVQAWREKLGLPSGLGEAARNVRDAAIGGAGVTLGIGAVAKGVGYGVSRLTRREQVEAFDALVENPTPEQIVARDQIAAEAAFEEANPFAPAVEPPPVQPGFVRMYHGGTEEDLGGDGARWFSSDRTYAEGYAKMRGEGGSPALSYVDLPADHPIFKEHDFYGDQGVAQGFTVNTELPAEIANQRKPIGVASVKEAAEADAEHYGRAGAVADAMDRDQPLPRFDEDPAPESLVDRTPDYEPFADPLGPEARRTTELAVRGYRQQIAELGDFEVYLDDVQGPVPASRMIEEFDADDAFLREIEGCA